MSGLSIHDGIIFSGIRPINPASAPQGVCEFATPVYNTLGWPFTPAIPKMIWWRFYWSDLLATASKLPFKDHPFYPTRRAREAQSK